MRVIEGEGVFILSDTRQTVLRGRLYEQIVPLLDGRSIDSLRQQLTPAVTTAQLFYTLKRLEQGGFLCEADEIQDPEATAFWAEQGVKPVDLARNKAKFTVRVIGVGIDVSPLRTLLENDQLRLGEEGDLWVVATDYPLRNELGTLDQQARAAGRPWLLVKPLGTQPWVGPLIQPGRPGCWWCLTERLRANSPILGYLDQMSEGGLAPPIPVKTAASLSVAWGLAANAVASWVTSGGRCPSLEGKLRSIDLGGTSLVSRSHQLVCRTSCPGCGQEIRTSETIGRPVTMRSQKKVYTSDGGHRCVSPKETLARYGHLVSPICGAVTALEPASGGQGDVLFVYHSGRNVGRGPLSLHQLEHDLRSHSAGKGITDVQARASALCEGLERYSAVFYGNEARRTARLLDLGDQGIHPNRCMLFSEEQFRTRGTSPSTLFGQVPRPFNPEAELEWAPVWSLTHQTFRYLPMSFCYFDYRDEGGQDNYCVSCSNGCAAGNTLEEAILQGFLEVVERDCVALWWYNRIQMPGIDLDSFHDPYMDRLRDFLRTKDRDLWALDLTNDLGIPAVAAISHRPNAPAQHVIFGFGAHLDPHIALLRAVTELNQMAIGILDAPLEGPPIGLSDHVTLNWLQKATVEEHPYLVPRPGALRSRSSFTYQPTNDLKEDVEACVTRMGERGLEILVLDQTRTEIEMPVAKVIVPGLRHFWQRFAPGRLYEVPVTLGWLPAPRSELDLNPVPMFL